MYAIIESGIEIDRYAEREHAEQAITELYLSGRWDDLVSRLVEVPVWIERLNF